MMTRPIFSDLETPPSGGSHHLALCPGPNASASVDLTVLVALASPKLAVPLACAGAALLVKKLCHLPHLVLMGVLALTSILGELLQRH
jgi:hypothetical protein